MIVAHIDVKDPVRAAAKAIRRAIFEGTLVHE
jgi:hypothetical protein